MVKKFLSLAGVLIFLLCMSAACQKKSRTSPLNEWMAESGRVKVLSTIAQIGDLTAEIGGERIDSWVLIQGTLDPHSYELVKGDGEKFERADLVFYHGLGLEHGAGLSAFVHQNAKCVGVGDFIQRRAPTEIIRQNGITDPHIWMDISLWAKSCDVIAEKLSSIDPEGASYYRDRAEELQKRMLEHHAKIRALLQEVPKERRYLVTSHDAFNYFSRCYLAEEGELGWEERFTAPEGLAPDGQLGPSDIRDILDYVARHKVGVLFPESNVSKDSIRKILSAGLEKGLTLQICKETLYGDAMDGENLHYLDMMEHNAETIAKYLGNP